MTGEMRLLLLVITDEVLSFRRFLLSTIAEDLPGWFVILFQFSFESFHILHQYRTYKGKLNQQY